MKRFLKTIYGYNCFCNYNYICSSYKILHTYQKLLQTLHNKWSFPLRISSKNMTKSAVSCGFDHIYSKNPSWKTSFFVRRSKILYFLNHPLTLWSDSRVIQAYSESETNSEPCKTYTMKRFVKRVIIIFVNYNHFRNINYSLHQLRLNVSAYCVSCFLMYRLFLINVSAERS